MERRKILIIVNNYYQKDIISSKRWRSLAEEFSKECDVTVICGSDYSYDGECIPIERLEHEHLKVIAFNTDKTLSLRARNKKEPPVSNIEQISKTAQNKNDNNDSFILGIKFILTSIITRFNIWKFCRKEQIERKITPPDTIITSIFTVNSYYIGKYLHRKWRGSQFVCEIRDRMVHGDTILPYQKHLYRSIQHDIVRSVDKVFTVSEQIKTDICLDFKKIDSSIIKVFPHAFDITEDHYICSGNKSSETNVLSICYTGTIYPTTVTEKCFKFFFRAIRLAMNVNHRLVFHYAGASSSLVRKWCEEEGIKDNVILHGFIPKKEALQLQQDCDVLLCIGPFYTGKGPEYVFSGKYILCVYSSDNASFLEMPMIISKANIGQSFCIDDNIKTICKEIERLFELKDNGKQILITPDRTVINQYSVDRIAKRMMKELLL